MRRDRDQVGISGLSRDIEPGDGLHRVGVHGRVRRAVPDQRGDAVERLDGPDLVVDEHHRDDRGVVVEGGGQGLEIDDPARVDTDHLDREPLLGETVGRGEHPLVLDGGGDDAVMTAGGPPEASDPLDAQVVGLGATAGEDHLSGLGAEHGGDRLPGLFERRLRRLGGAVNPGRVGEATREVRPHGGDRLRAHRRARRVVEVRHAHPTSLRAASHRPPGGAVGHSGE